MTAPHAETLRAYLIERGVLIPAGAPGYEDAFPGVLSLDARARKRAAKIIYRRSREAAERLLTDGHPTDWLVQHLRQLAQSDSRRGQNQGPVRPA